jgi:hypothetical protein
MQLTPRHAALLIGLGCPAFAETTETLKLAPFEVQADRDKSYGALNSNSITQFSASLDHLPISADIFTDTTMKDLGNPSVEQIITTYSAWAGMGSAVSDPGSGAATTQPGDRSPGLELRGKGGSTNQRDGIVGFAGNTQTAGLILSGHLDWNNVQSFGGSMFSEKTLMELTDASVETQWNSWLSCCRVRPRGVAV